MRDLHVVVPEMVDDPRRPTGGNVYDRELVQALRDRGVDVAEHRAGLRLDLTAVPDGATVVVDGLLALDQPGAFDPRLQVVPLVHLPPSLGSPGDAGVAAREREALSRAAAVIATSEWTRTWLLDHHRLSPDRVSVAAPGVQRGPVTTASEAGNRLLVVGAVTRAKGLDLLAAALGDLAELSWTCRVVGPVDREPELASRLAGLGDRVEITGPLVRELMPAAYAEADLLVAPTRLETYGMAVTEALAHGVPVVAADTGGVAEALGRTEHGRPGVLVRPEAADALAGALRTWLTDADRRRRLRSAAADRRETLLGWDATAEAVVAAVNRCGLRTVVRA